MKTERKHRRPQGFTLIELLVAVAILGILGTVAIKEIWSFIDEAKQTSTKTKADSIYTIVQDFKRKNNRLPRDLGELTEPDDRKGGASWLTQDDLYDAWDNEFVLVFGERSNEFEIVSYGANGLQDGYNLDLGLDRDISSNRPLNPKEER